jgi:hypothetical protein
VERVQPGQTFDVPRTALLLTGSVKSLLPLPASFSAAVQNPKRHVSAADLLWPSNISGGQWSGASSEDSSSGHAQAGQHGSSSSISRQQSAPALNPVHGQPSPNDALPAQQQQQMNGVSSGASAGQLAGGSSSSTCVIDPLTATASAVKVVVHDSTGSSDAKAAAAAASRAPGCNGVGSHAVDDDPLLLAAPAELPPGEFTCTVEAMVLQVRNRSPLLVLKMK